MNLLRIFVLTLIVATGYSEPRAKSSKNTSSEGSKAESSRNDLAVVPAGRTVPVGAQVSAIREAAAQAQEFALAQRAAIQNAIVQAEAAESVGSQAQQAAVRDAIAQTHNERIQEANNQGQILRNSIAQAQAVQIQIALARKLAARNAAIQALHGDSAGVAQAVSNANSEAHVNSLGPDISPVITSGRGRTRSRARPVVPQSEIEVITLAPLVAPVELSVPQSQPQSPFAPVSYSLSQIPVAVAGNQAVLRQQQQRPQISPITLSRIPATPISNPSSALHVIPAPNLGPSAVRAQVSLARPNPLVVSYARPNPSLVSYARPSVQLQQIPAQGPIILRQPPRNIHRPLYSVPRSPPQYQHISNPFGFGPEVPLGGGYGNFGFGGFPDLAFGASSFMPWG